MTLTVSNLCDRLSAKLPDPHFVLVGDVHGRYDIYKDIIHNAHCSLQVGDMVGKNGGQLDRYEALTTIDPIRHCFIGGNHENYISEKVESDSLHSFDVGPEKFKFSYMPEHCLGHYGVWRIPDVESDELSGEIFFLRGAWSIDGPGNPFGFIPTTLGVDYFNEEELSMQQLYAALELYDKAKPDFVVTHTCPQSFQKNLTLAGKGKSSQTNGQPNVTRTGQLLDVLLEIHRPKIWVFGHYHQSKVMVQGETLFVCLERVEYNAPNNLVNGACLCFDKQLRLLMR